MLSKSMELDLEMFATGSNHVMRSNFNCRIVVAMKSGGGRRREEIEFSE
jgi:hypothetical protein